MPKTTTVRWGVIGAGRIAKQFCRDIAHTPLASVGAIAAREQTRAGAFAAEFAIANAYGCYQDMYGSPEVDAIYIATPHTHHYAQARASLLAGKHVLVEKPFTVTPEESKALIALADARGLFLMEAMWTAFLPAIKRARAWIERGGIGEVVRLTADFGYPIAYREDLREYDATLGGGCLLEMGIYPLALAFLIFADLPSSQDMQFLCAPNGVEDDLAILAHYGDKTAFLATSFRAKLPNIAYIVGTKGWIEIPDFWRATSATLYCEEEEVDQFQDMRLGDGFEYQIHAASQAILNGERETSEMPLTATQMLQNQMYELLQRIHARPTANIG